MDDESDGWYGYGIRLGVRLYLVACYVSVGEMTKRGRVT